MGKILLFALLAMSSSLYAGSWILVCSSDDGSIIFTNDNSLASITINSIEADVDVSWVGDPNILTDSYENICHRDHAVTVFEQKIKMTTKNNEVIESEVLCREEIFTNAGIPDSSLACDEKLEI